MSDSHKELVEISLLDGVNIYKMNSTQFKTDIISICFIDGMKNETATHNSLFPAILRRGSKTLSTLKHISIRLEELYDATLDYVVFKKGDLQVVQFYIRYVKEIYTNKKNMFEQAFKILIDIIANPISSNNEFNSDYFFQEKQHLSDLIKSRINDKMSYALDRCYEEMCKDEPFGIYTYGSTEHLDKITNKELFLHYKNFIRTRSINIHISSSEEHSFLLHVIQDGLLKFRRIGTVYYSYNTKNTSINGAMSTVKKIEEKLDVSQAKLSIGFRTFVPGASDDFYKLLVLNSILGDGSHSKLFQNVRETQGLAYYVFSTVERFKELLLICAGIDESKKDLVIDSIINQINDIKNGIISDYEYECARNILRTSLLSIHDNQFSIIDFYNNHAILDASFSVSKSIERILSVSKQDVVDISQKLMLDTIYSLVPSKSKKEEGAHSI